MRPHHRSDAPIRTCIVSSLRTPCLKGRIKPKICVQLRQGSEDSSEDWKAPIDAIEGKPAIVALGKFDALHKGHRSLVEKAAAMGGYPWMLTFSGMAEVLGWPRRPPLVPERHRSAILETWAGSCQGLVPREHSLPFDKVRTYKPDQFVELLVEMQVAGAVVGKGYRFGYKQEGTADMLKTLGTKHGMKIQVLDLVGAATPGVVGNVSSTEVRRAVAGGKVRRLRDYLDRRYQLLAVLPEMMLGQPIRIPVEAFMNQLPAQRQYSADVRLQYAPAREVNLAGCNVTVAETEVLIEHKNLPQIQTPVADAQVTIWL